MLARSGTRLSRLRETRSIWRLLSATTISIRRRRTYRLIEIPLDAVDVFPSLNRWLAEGYGAETVEALRRDDAFPPVVGQVVGAKFVLLDGVHRLIACVALGRDRVTAYDLLA